MKRTTYLFTIMLFVLTACSGNTGGTVQMPMVVDVVQPQMTPENTPVIEPSAKPTAEIIGNPYPLEWANTDKRDEEVPEVAEPTPSTFPYPIIIDTQEPEIIKQTTIAVEPTPTIESDFESPANPAEIVDYDFRVISEFPHDRGSFVQGLVVDDEPGILLEGSGLWGESSLRRVNLETGEVLQVFYLPNEYFGEGITLFKDHVIQLTWKSGRGFVYDSDTFELIDEFTYAHEGWGITHNGEQLLVSDGTDVIHYWDPQTFEETGQIQVYDDLGPVNQLNELEFINGEIFANVWQTDIIVRIDPQSGEILGRIDLTGLLVNDDRIGTENVLNGIAYDKEEDRLFVTGKRWPKLYEIELISTEELD